MGITRAGNLGVPLAVFVYWVLYISVESYIMLFLLRTDPSILVCVRVLRVCMLC